MPNTLRQFGEVRVIPCKPKVFFDGPQSFTPTIAVCIEDSESLIFVSHGQNPLRANMTFKPIFGTVSA